MHFKDFAKVSDKQECLMRFWYAEWLRNKFLTSKGYRNSSVSPNEIQFELQIIQVMYLTFKENYKN